LKHTTNNLSETLDRVENKLDRLLHILGADNGKNNVEIKNWAKNTIIDWNTRRNRDKEKLP
jgi:hypothetical protein